MRAGTEHEPCCRARLVRCPNSADTRTSTVRISSSFWSTCFPLICTKLSSKDYSSTVRILCSATCDTSIPVFAFWKHGPQFHHTNIMRVVDTGDPLVSFPPGYTACSLRMTAAIHRIHLQYLDQACVS